MTTRGAGLRVGLVGLGFGAEFVPIHLNHPDVERLTYFGGPVPRAAVHH